MAELLGVLFCVVVLLQKGYLVLPKPQKSFLLVLSYADVLDRIRRQGLLIPLDRAQLAVSLDSAPAADGEGAQHPLLGAAGNAPGEQIHVGLSAAEHRHFDPHTFQGRDAPGINEVPVLRDFS